VDEARKDDPARLSRSPVEYAVHNISQRISLPCRVTVAGAHPFLGKRLGADEVPFATGLWIGPCETIHTFGRDEAIDVLFLDNRFVVCKLHPHLPPRRVSVCLAADSVLELQAGVIARTGTKVGDHLLFEGLF
jgi:hypothetical protein